MTKPFSVAFKQKMVQRLTGKNPASASQLARETGVRQQNLSRWLQEARSVPVMADKPKPAVRAWTVEQKVRVLAEASPPHCCGLHFVASRNVCRCIRYRRRVELW